MLFSFDVISFHPYRRPKIQGIAFVHLRTRGIWETDSAIRLLPDLQALSGERVVPGLGPDVTEGTAYTKQMSIEIFSAGSENDDFVESGFKDFLNSRRARC